jgi:peptide chain release factor
MNEKIIIISAGRGPAECCWVVAKVLKEFLKDLKDNGFSAEVIQKTLGMENRTLQSVSVSITAKDQLEDFLAGWIGTIQWIGQSTFRRHHKRKNWFVAIMEIKEQRFSIDLKDVRMDTMRSGGKGGQHVNKVSTAVRLTHLPTGIAVVSSDQRSQSQNKKLAYIRLEERLKSWQKEQRSDQQLENWLDKIQIERGNPIRVFRGTDFKSVKKDNKFSKSRKLLKSDLRKQLNELK